MGLDVQALVERLCRPGCDVFTELDATREEHLAIFQSGKAVTAIISNLARRRKLKIALTVWNWIDSVGIKKNTFHYNSMISVCEKVRDYTKALKLLDEMKAKSIAKNEVTYVSISCHAPLLRLPLLILVPLFYQLLFCNLSLRKVRPMEDSPGFVGTNGEVNFRSKRLPRSTVAHNHCYFFTEKGRSWSDSYCLQRSN